MNSLVNPNAMAVRLHAALLDLTDPSPPTDHDTDRGIDRGTDRAVRGDAGQATTEYALVLLAAALVALLVVGWATAGGGAAKVGRLFDRVIDWVIVKV